MSIIQIGNYSGAIYQTEQPLHLNPDGSAQATLTFKASRQASYVIPRYLTPHPVYNALQCYESDLDYEPGGVVRITTIYKGVLAENPNELGQHDFSRTLVEAPIETHPIFALPRDNPPVTPQKLAEIELSLQNCTDPNPDWDKPTRLLWEKKRRGIETYLKPGGIYRVSYCSNSIPDPELLERAGKIFSPPNPCPSPPSGQNYLCMGISWVKEAGVVRITEEYQLSGQGGWDPDLYYET